MNLKELIQEKAEEIEQELRTFLPREEGYQKTVAEAMNYSIMAGGKRLRPMLMRECAALFGEEPQNLLPLMAAIEMIHNYSLVHDDLPAMDNDEYRRGRKTTHVVYGEGMAVLAGDGLLNFAFETAMKAAHGREQAEDLLRVIKSVEVLGKKAGIYGMIGGQCADLEAEAGGQDLTEELLMFIHEHKTAALIQAAMMIGGIMAGADEEQITKLETCGYYIGIAFQIQDDILDVIGNEEQLGKPIGSDARNEKLTYVTMHGLEESSAQVRSMTQKALQILDEFPRENRFLKELVTFLITREY